MAEKFSMMRTGDGTYTLFSEEYAQAMHTIDGAYSEAVIKHILPSKVLEKKEPLLRILDVGFGIGYNVLALLERFMKNTEGCFLEIISLEKDFGAISLMGNPFPDDIRSELYSVIIQLAKDREIVHKRYALKLIEGDARRTVQKIENGFFHAIFHDPYSPKKNPELWTVEFFCELYRVAKDGCMLTTYSSAPHVRSALMDAGFMVGKGPGMGKKREGTIASKGGCIEALSDEERALLCSKKQSVPCRDPEFASTREEILARRIDEMKRFN